MAKLTGGDNDDHDHSSFVAAEAKDPFDRRAGIFYALLLPGFLGLVYSVVNRKRARDAVFAS